MKTRLEIVPISELKPLEKVFESHLTNLKEMIGNTMLKPLIIDEKTGIILDGSHRYAFLYGEGYLKAPVLKVDYLGDDIRVGSRLVHRFLIAPDDLPTITKQEVLERGLTGRLFEPRTTRHFFPFRKENWPIEVNRLTKGEPRDIKHLISDASRHYEIEHNKKFIKEIEEEIEAVVSYLSESVETKKYLEKQVSMMKKPIGTAFFPGKFHPPHIGHFATISKLATMYDEVIVAVSGDMPKDAVLSQLEIENELERHTEHLKNVRVMSFEGRLIDRKDTVGLPAFDYLVSGNKDVVRWGESVGLKSQFIPRSEGFNTRGSDLRKQK